MSDRPRDIIPARTPQPELVPQSELERIRCEARSGLHEPVVGRLLDHVAIQDQVIHQIAKRTREVGTPQEQAEVAAALELHDAAAPVHIHVGFDVAPTNLGGGAGLIEAIREWTLDEITALADQGQVTATFRGSAASWETRLP